MAKRGTGEQWIKQSKGWSTAQDRFGPPLRVTGVQHPAPALACLLARDAESIIVSAPFAPAQACRTGQYSRL